MFHRNTMLEDVPPNGLEHALDRAGCRLVGFWAAKMVSGPRLLKQANFHVIPERVELSEEGDHLLCVNWVEH